jgi:prepilin-type N-terminal cleavage/methylation domain-containing protein
MRRGGFTLIEVIAVVVLLGVLAGSALWRMTEQVQRGSRAGATGQISYADRMARLASSRLGRRSILRFDLDQQQITRYDGPEARRKVNVGRGVTMPVRFGIDRIVRVAESSPSPAGRLDVRKSGVVDIEFGPSGRSQSYALRLGTGEEFFWIVFSGLTGQLTTLDDEKEIDNLFALLATGRPDAY